MVQSASEAAHEYKLTLEELVNNNKMQINLLTILAEDYQSYPEAIVETIEKQIYTVPKERKLPILYVIDSILKNVAGMQYKECFQKIIIKIFLHVFVHSDEKVRGMLFKLRTTWGPIFQASTLYKLDMKVNSEDNNWPIVNPRTQTAQGSGSGTSVANGRPPAPSGQVHVNPKFLPNQPVTNPPTTISSRDPRQAAQAARAQVETTDPVPSASEAKAATKPPAQVKAEPKDSKSSMDVLDTILGAPDVRIKEEPDEPVPPRKTTPPKRKSNDPRQQPIGKKTKPNQPPKDEDLRVHQHKKAPGSRFNDKAHPLPNKPSPQLAAPSTATALPGSHAFDVVIPARNTEFPSGPQHTFPNIPPPGVFIPPSQPQPFAPPIENKSVISHEGVKLEGIPANNRIFVDGRAHEVFYVDETAVIERNGLPHRIYFAGPPRNVIIDGVAHLLHFGERKTVYIDGQPHVLRFGSPSKELYMGHYAFKGQFGGPPIIAIIDNMRHEIRLSGPPPEVRIEPDPAYDLARFMPQIREGKAPVHSTKPSSESPFDLLRRLQQSGLLQQKKEKEKPREKPRFTPIHKETTPPRPSEHTFDLVERKLAPATSLRDFNMRLLKIRYQAIVDALHEKQRNACPQCGMRMELSGEKYARHMDWHVKRNLQTLERSSTSRPWFPADKDWLTSEDESMAGPSQSSEVKEEPSGPAPAVGCADAPNKECTVCGEAFEEYFDEEEDMWKLRNTVKHYDKVCHVGCLQDVSVLESSTMSSSAPSVISDTPFVVDDKPLKLVTQSQ